MSLCARLDARPGAAAARRAARRARPDRPPRAAAGAARSSSASSRKTVLFVTHDLAEAGYLADDLIADARRTRSCSAGRFGELVERAGRRRSSRRFVAAQRQIADVAVGDGVSRTRRLARLRLRSGRGAAARRRRGRGARRARPWSSARRRSPSRSCSARWSTRARSRARDAREPRARARRHARAVERALQRATSTPISSTPARSCSEILREDAPRPTPHVLARCWRETRRRIAAPLGFNNTYVLGMREASARALGITRDLGPAGASRAALRALERVPGAARTAGRACARRTRLPQRRAARAASTSSRTAGSRAGAIDVIDLYSTDAEIAYYGLRRLEDDSRYFPRYDAVLLYRQGLRRDAVARARAARRRRSTRTRWPSSMPRCKIDGRPATAVAAAFLQRAARDARRRPRGTTGSRRFVDRTRRAPAAGRRSRWARRSWSRAARRCWPTCRRVSARSCWRCTGDRADHPVARAAGAHDPVARDRRAAGDRGAVSLQPAADRAQHADRPDGHPAGRPRVGRGARPAARARGCGWSSCRSRRRRSWPASRPRR